MADAEIERLRQIIEESRREKEELRRKEEKAERIIEEQRKEIEQRKGREEQLEQKPTTLPEFLHGYHNFLFRGLAVQTPAKPTTGKLDDAENKFRPDKIRRWRSFPDEQDLIWKDIMNVDFVMERHFTSLHTLRENGNNLRNRMLSSELDLGYFERHTVEDRVSAVINKLCKNEWLSAVFDLKISISFENHGNSIDGRPDEEPAEENPRPSKLVKKLPDDPDQTSSTPFQLTHGQLYLARTSSSEAQTVPALIIEYKAPHKLPIEHIRLGLEDMEVDDMEVEEVLREKKKPTTKETCRYLIAAVITQAFSYMITASLTYGYICTGEAFIFLHVKPEDPSVVYSFLSIPGEDVKDSTGWNGDITAPNRLHVTAIGQVLAFTLRAMREDPLDQAWRNQAMDNLERWEMSYDVIWNETPVKVVPVNERPLPGRGARLLYAEKSPISKRTRSAAIRPGYRPAGDQAAASNNEEDDSEDELDLNTPSRKGLSRSTRVSVMLPPPPPAWAKGQSGKSKGKGPREYCTHKCLLGLVNGGLLDQNCPNVNDHGIDYHVINISILTQLLHDQILTKNLKGVSTLGCEPMYFHGVTASLFQVTLVQYGYTIAGKGVRSCDLKDLQREESVYELLRPISRETCPSVFGSSKYLKTADAWRFHHAGISAFEMKFDEDRIAELQEEPRQAIENLGVRHTDLHRSNQFWNKENKCLMVIDFMAAVITQKKPLESLPESRKRERSGSLNLMVMA
ncbi:hypothetical protein FQN57_001485 [Myotisia sp. PD_48]|nr:hypothetical protein FQN57_001485 [Myotisia sp. PD_48]